MKASRTVKPVLDRLSALAEATRCRMLLLLELHELTVTELCTVLRLPQSTASRHLKTLADAGWVASRRDGTSRFYTHSLEGEGSGERKLWFAVRDEVAQTSGAEQDGRRLEGVLAARRAKSGEFFRSAASRWDRLRDELFGRTFHLEALLGLLDPKWVVGDLGCGTGQVSAALAPHVRRVMAVDGSREMLDEARRRLAGRTNVTLQRCELETLAIDDGALDVAIVLLVLHHVINPATVLAEAARALTPGGVILIADMLSHDREEYRREMGHVWLGFPEKFVRRMLAAAGFEGVRFHQLPVEPEAKGPALFVAVARRPEHRPSKMSD